MLVELAMFSLLRNWVANPTFYIVIAGLMLIFFRPASGMANAYGERPFSGGGTLETDRGGAKDYISRTVIPHRGPADRLLLAQSSEKRGRKRRGRNKRGKKKNRGGQGSTGRGGKNPRKVVARWDKNGDGKVSRSEWGKSKRQFSRMDANNDGFLTAAEIWSAWRGKKKFGGTESVELDAGGEAPELTFRQATKITGNLGGLSTAAAPRSIDDITAILDQQKPIDPQEVERKRREAERKPPGGASDSELAVFYLRRGRAARHMGLSRQELSDLKKAARLAKTSNSPKRAAILKELGRTYAFVGKKAEALRYRKLSLRLLKSKGKKRKTFGIRNVLVGNYASVGQFRKAERVMAGIERDLANYPRKPGWQRVKARIVARAQRAKANLLDTKGRFKEAEGLYRAALIQVEKEIKSGRASHTLRSATRLGLSKNLLRQEKFIDAEIVARKALIDELARIGKYSTETTRVLLQLVGILGAQGRFDEASQLASAAVDIIVKIGLAEGSVPMVQARKSLAKSHFNNDELEKALAIYDRIRESIKNDADIFEARLLGDKTWHLAMVLGGRHEEAIPIIRNALNNRRIRRKGGRATLRGALAAALTRSGQLPEAYEEFKKIVDKMTSYEGGEDEEYTGSTTHERFISIVLEAYLEFLADVYGTPNEKAFGLDAMAEAFRIADAARGRSVSRALSASSARVAVDDEKLANLLRLEQDTQKRTTAQSGLLASLLSAPLDQQDQETIQSLRAEVGKLRAARTSLNKEINRRFPAYAELIHPKPPTIGAVREKLRDGESFISIYVGRDRTFVWAVPKSGEAHFANSDIGRDRLEKTVDALRDALNPQAQTLGDIPDFDVRLAHKLYRLILAPVKSAWVGSRSLLVSTNGALGQLPLSLLPTKRTRRSNEKEPLFAEYREVPWLARTHAMTMVPSASSLITLRSLPPGDPGRSPFIGFGDPYFNAKQAEEAKKPKAPVLKVAGDISSRGLRTRGLRLRLRSAPILDTIKSPDLSILPRLPDTAEEVRSLAITMQTDLSKSVMLGANANEKMVKSLDLTGFRVVAFATHGLVPGDLSGLSEPALALSAPEISDTDGDGLLTMSEILGLKLDADWVVLSACNTGTGRGAGAEAVSGLGRAFFYAGTRALLVSSWPVETTSARLLTTDIFRRQTAKANLERSEALRQAMVALIDGSGHTDKTNGKTLYYYSHPIFWAPFILVGDGGGVTGAHVKK